MERILWSRHAEDGSGEEYRCKFKGAPTGGQIVVFFLVVVSLTEAGFKFQRQEYCCKLKGALQGVLCACLVASRRAAATAGCAECGCAAVDHAGTTRARPSGPGGCTVARFPSLPPALRLLAPTLLPTAPPCCAEHSYRQTAWLPYDVLVGELLAWHGGCDAALHIDVCRAQAHSHINTPAH